MSGQNRRSVAAPLVIELYAGTFGWSAGWLAMGGQAVGFDLEHQPWHGPVPDGAELVLQDVRTLHGRQFKDADLILASPPCQEFSWRAMPWTRAKQAPPPELGMELFRACFRLQREACEAAGRHIPMVVENVCGAQKWVGRAAWHFGSYYLWGDVPALMPIVSRRHAMKGGDRNKAAAIGGHVWTTQWAAASEGTKVPTGASWRHPDDPRHVAGLGFNTHADRQTKAIAAIKHDDEATKCGGDWFGKGQSSPMRMGHSKGAARRAASALIARIPTRLSEWIAECYWPADAERVA